MVCVQNKGGGGKVKLGKTVEHSLRNTGDPCQPQRESPWEDSSDRPQCHLVSFFAERTTDSAHGFPLGMEQQNYEMHRKT